MGFRRGVICSALLLALLAPAAALARGGASITYPEGPDPAVTEWPSWPDPVSCGGLAFDPVAAFGGETGVENGTGGAEEALRTTLGQLEASSIPTRFWRVMAASETWVEFAQGRLAQGPARIAVELSGGQWRLSGRPDYCTPRTVREGSEGASWRLDEGQRLTPGTRRIKIDLIPGYGGCDGGRSLNEDAQKPVFRQFGRRLVLTTWLDPLPPGIYTCQARIESPLVVKLPGRLGDRRLFDGRTYPPRPRR